MVVFAGTKINLGLYVTGKRADGFHNLESCFYPTPLSDVVEVVPSANGITTLHETGLTIGGDPEKNLAYRAWKLLSEHHNCPAAEIHLHKMVPSGAGLGGGSADAVAVLKACNHVFSLGLAEDQLLTLAAELGSDCPFFVRNEPTWVTGRGEVMEPFSLNLKGLHITLVHPGVGVSTAATFKGINPRPAPDNWAAVLQKPIVDWKDALHNQFEDTVIPQLAVIGQIKQALYDGGALYASMSGSGSTVYALSHEPLKAETLHEQGFFVFQSVL